MIIKRDRAGLDATKIPTDRDIAFAAGFYEGEGSCVKTRQSFGVRIAQKDPEILYRMRDLFGGTIAARVNGGFDVNDWSLCGDRARVFLAVIYPLLSSRRKSQIDNTKVRIFLDFVGSVPEENAFAFVRSKLNQWQTELRTLAVARDKQHRKEFYERQKAVNPDFMKKRREWTAAWRSRNKLAKVVAIA